MQKKNKINHIAKPISRKRWFQIALVGMGAGILFIVAIVYQANDTQPLDAYFSLREVCRPLGLHPDKEQACDTQTSLAFNALVNDKGAILVECPDLSDDLYQEAIDAPQYVIDCVKAIGVFEDT